MTHIQHHPTSIEDACANEYAGRCSAAERLCQWLSSDVCASWREVRGAQHVCDRLVASWAEFAVARDTQQGAQSPINPRFL